MELEMKYFPLPVEGNGVNWLHGRILQNIDSFDKDLE